MTLETDVFDPTLEVEILTDKAVTKEAPCRKCRRRCIVTRFATVSKVECNTCRTGGKQQKTTEFKQKMAATVDPATLANLDEALINPQFKHALCPFGEDHEMELKSVSHSPNYGPRHLVGYDGKGFPQYEQQTGESAMLQCNTCRCVISFSTMHPSLLQAQNESRVIESRHGSELERALGVRAES